ncbi:glycosyl hydrolase family 18 protein [Salininema proteolyticum]|uniref:chitinase n=1 Tax=Salininema proteolyticum TaxID=1607685 RepID=A0ABV8TTJ0_9ACTN
MADKCEKLLNLLRAFAECICECDEKPTDPDPTDPEDPEDPDPTDPEDPEDPEGPSTRLTGFYHASFTNEAGAMRLADVTDEWETVNIAFAVCPGDDGTIVFERDDAVVRIESDEEFAAAVKAHQDRGAKVLLSLGGERGIVRLRSEADRDRFVSSIKNLVETWGFDGIDLDFEGSLYLNRSDKDFENPTTPVIVNLIAALRQLVEDLGEDFTITMTPEVRSVQAAIEEYGASGEEDDQMRGAYLPVIHALRDIISQVNVQHYNTDMITDAEGNEYAAGTADFHVALVDLLIQGFPVGTTGQTFPGLDVSQVGIALPATADAAYSGFTESATMVQALDVLTGKADPAEDGYVPAAAYEDLAGLTAWSVNWNRKADGEFTQAYGSYFSEDGTTDPVDPEDPEEPEEPGEPEPEPRL